MATHDFERISVVKKSAEGRLLAIPGVHAVGLGAKNTGGRRTREPAVVVFVSQKKPAATLLAHEIVPTEIDGVKTDVWESPPPRLLSDTKTYRPLVGGCQIEGGGSLPAGGTLGCIARIDGPVPTIVGITNQHVVGNPPAIAATQLSFEIDNPPEGVNDLTITFKGANTPRTLILVDWALRTGNELGPKNRAFYGTRSNQSLADIARGVKDAIGSLAAGISSSAAGSKVTLAALDGGRFDTQVRVFGPHAFSEPADLRTTVEGNDITLTGKVSGDYGIFTHWNVGGLVPTRGVYTRVRKGRELVAVASDIVARIKSLGLPGIDASVNGAKVSITGVQQVECDVSSDERIGQATACFCSACCACCGNLIGTVRDARIDLDVALIELEAGLKYRAEIQDIGAVKGTRSYNIRDLVLETPILVRKRGAKTGLSVGWLSAIDVVGDVEGALRSGNHYHRYFSNALHVSMLDGIPFCEPGDSGSAAVNQANEVIGILFGGSPEAFVTPIAQIENAFDLVVERAGAVGATSTVPATQGHHSFAAVQTEPIFVHQLRAMEAELTATASGRELADVGRRNAGEVVRLVNHNRRVGTVWRRNGGPELVQAAFTLAQSDEKHLPPLINGRPLVDCLRRMQEILVRYGSAQLVADLRQFGPRILALTKLDYPQLLAALEAVPE